ncbi:tetratricopeptide repeat protein [Gymnodinialimonas hymeniacidonis]|uniref:tetratricopeptide repeat protein n=1 Tax=Gymnodinialimonas hymeniacidonis TaxID=3126508 RepID=UPI0034C6603B
MSGAAIAQDETAAERAAAVEDALAAFEALAAGNTTEGVAQTDAEEDSAVAVEEALSAFAALAAETAARAEEEAAEARQEAVSQAQDAFAALAAETAARAEEESAAERDAAVGAAQDAFAALAAESAARAEEEAAQERASAVEAAQSAFAAMAAEAEAAASREAAIADAQAAFEALAAESAARAEAQLALETCISVAGEPSAENFPTEEAQAAALNALREAMPACRAAAEALPEEGAPFFHLATAAQASGRHRRAVPLYEQAAENGVIAALTRLGDYHNFGLRPVREDAAQAVEYYRSAAEAGDPAGTATLAFMYRLGRGVDQSGAEYLRLMEEAAASGYPFAQQNLAETYLSGEGVPRDELETLGLPNARAAVPLLVSLANEGSVEAVQSLIELYSDGAEGVAPSDFLRGGWVETLAETGDPVGIAERGFLYEQGIGRAANPELAAADYVAALETGEVDIDTMRGTIDGQTPPWDRDTAIAFQTILAERGVYTMRIDGDVGPGTRRAADALAEAAEE